jgi:hypothetical protein
MRNPRRSPTNKDFASAVYRSAQALHIPINVAVVFVFTIIKMDDIAKV